MHAKHYSVFSSRDRFASLRKLACCSLVSLPLLLNTSFAQTVTLNPDVVGSTPSIIGINSGNFLPDNNTSSFLRWVGVNGSRTFTSAANIEQTDDIPGVGDGVNSQQSLLARMAAVRANPTDPSLINFSVFENGYQNNESNFINYDHAYGEYAANNISALAIINRTNGQFPFAAAGTEENFADQYEHWQHYYAQAYYLGSNHGVERYSTFNEPDAGSQDVTQEDFLLRLQLASDAVQSALQDVNRDFGTNLQANVSAPITAGGAPEYFARTDNTDTRDDNQGWGELVINNLNTNFLGEVDPDFQLVQTYAYQQYNQTSERFADDLSFIQQSIDDDIADNGLVGEVNVGLTEFNVNNNGTFATRTDDLNTPSRYAGLGGIITELTNQEVDELYIFKVDSNAEDDFLQKSALFGNSRTDEPFNIGGATSAAGVYKLFTKGFAGSQDLLEEATHSVNNLEVATSFNAEEDTYFVLSANESTNDRSLTFDASDLGIEAGAIVQIEEVSEGNIAEVTDRFVVPSDGLISVDQSGRSVVLLSVPKTASDTVLELTATSDATVRAGSNSGDNTGDGNNISVRNITDSSNAQRRAVGLLEFDTSAIENLLLDRAVLELRGEIDEGSADFVTTHLFAVTGADFDEETVTWDSVSNLLSSDGDVNTIADNFVTGVSDTAEFLGHLTFGRDFETVSVDITDYLLANLEDLSSELNQDGILRLLIAREVRFDGNDVDGDGIFEEPRDNIDASIGGIRFNSKDNTNDPDFAAPRLILELSSNTVAVPEPSMATALLLGLLSACSVRRRKLDV